MKLVRVKIDGTMDELETTSKNAKSLKSLENLAISKGTSCFKELYHWNSEGKKYLCYGWFDGDPGFENKHELIRKVAFQNSETPHYYDSRLRITRISQENKHE